MHRTQVYLESDLVAQLQELARREGTSMADLIRRAARRFIQDAEGQDLWAADDPIWGLAGLLTEGPAEDTSEHVDDYLYGDHRPRPLRLLAERKSDSYDLGQ